MGKLHVYILCSFGQYNVSVVAAKYIHTRKINVKVNSGFGSHFFSLSVQDAPVLNTGLYGTAEHVLFTL
jgi:hypothetical protein